MAIRQATAADFEGVLTLVNQLLVELGGQAVPREAAEGAFRHLVTAHWLGFVLVYEKDSTVVGVCTASMVQAIRSFGRYLIIQEMYVVPELRSQGIGTDLVKGALAQARLLGCSMVELGTPLDGERQEQFYERLGFERVGSRLRKRLLQ